MIKSQFSLEGYSVPYSKTLDSLHEMKYRLFIPEIVASSLLSERDYVNVYNSLHDSVDEDTLKSIKFCLKMSQSR